MRFERILSTVSLFRQISVLALVACTALLFSIEQFTNSVEIKQCAVAVLATLATIAWGLETGTRSKDNRPNWGRLLRSPFTLPWLLFAIYATLRIVETHWNQSSLELVWPAYDARAALYLWWTAWLVAILVFVCVAELGFLRAWLGLHALIGVLVGGYAFLQALRIDDNLFLLCGLAPVEWPDFEWAMPIRRVVGTLGNPDFLAGYLIGTVPLLLPLWHLAPERDVPHVFVRSLVVISGVCQFLGIILSLSRGVWIGFGFAMIAGGLLWWTHRRITRPVQVPETHKKRVTLVTSIVLVTIVVAVIWPTVQTLGQRFTQADDASVGGRTLIYRATFDLIERHPWFGTGMGTFGKYFPETRSIALSRFEPFVSRFIGHAHSEWLELPSELGLIGFVLWLWLLVVLFRMGWRSSFDDDPRVAWISMGCLLGATGILGHNLVTVTLRHSSTLVLFWQLVGVIAGLYSLRAIPESTSSGTILPNRLSRRFCMAAIGIVTIGVLWYPAVRHVVTEHFVHDAHSLSKSLEMKRVNTRSQYIAQNRTALQLLAMADYYEPDRKDVWNWRGWLALNLTGSVDEPGDFATALRCYQHILDFAGNFIGTRHNIATVHLMASRFLSEKGLLDLAGNQVEESIRWSALAVTDDPSDPKYNDYYARALYISAGLAMNATQYDLAAQRYGQAKEFMQRAGDLYLPIANPHEKNEAYRRAEQFGQLEARARAKIDNVSSN